MGASLTSLARTCRSRFEKGKREQNEAEEERNKSGNHFFSLFQFLGLFFFFERAREDEEAFFSEGPAATTTTTSSFSHNARTLPLTQQTDYIKTQKKRNERNQTFA